jgi:hypothetical protein
MSPEQPIPFGWLCLFLLCFLNFFTGWGGPPARVLAPLWNGYLTEFERQPIRYWDECMTFSNHRKFESPSPGLHIFSPLMSRSTFSHSSSIGFFFRRPKKSSPPGLFHQWELL